MIGVLIADHQALVRRGFRMILEIEQDIEVVGEAVDGRDALDKVNALRPEVVLIDVRMPGLDGIAATQQLTGVTRATTRVIMLTTFDSNWAM